jgi:formate dehydrogenase (NADP+) beta subunit
LHPSKSLNRILSNSGKVIGTEFLDVESFSFDEDRNLQLETVENSQQYIESDTFTFAIGQTPEMPQEFSLDMRINRFINSKCRGIGDAQY